MILIVDGVQGECEVGPAGKRKSVYVKKISREPMSPEEQATVERTLADLIARAYCADHPELFKRPNESDPSCMCSPEKAQSIKRNCGKGVTMRKGISETESPYISARELAERWRCARSSVDRIIRRAGLHRLCLGDGKNGMVRYIRKEVELFEKSRQV
jgi:hypothetical protein